ncbi:MAG: translocation/assembly module TamB domain-containing protein [Cyclobacteriaceae bacterium]|nr:translocation/assembly module TamB domain-containing protein [Cyclobacteriaceae bacterium]
MNLQVIKIRVLFWLKSITLYGLYGIVLLTITGFFIIQIPAVQSALTQRYLKSFSTSTGFATTIGRVELHWFDRLYLEDIAVLDPENNTMIGVKRLFVNFKLSSLFSDNNLSIDAVRLDGADVNLVAITDADSTRDLNINILVDRINKMSGESTGGGSVLINIGEALLKNSHFSLHAGNDSISSGFDPNHFSLSIPDIELQRFLIQGDTIQFNLNSLTATEERLDFTVHQLSTFFRISQQSMEFIGLKASAGESILSDTIIFRYESQFDLNDFIDRVNIHANFSNTIIYPKDLALFAPLPEKLTDPISLVGSFNGRINRFRFTGMNLQVGDTQLQGALEMDGLPDINETFIILNLRESQIDFKDLAFIFNNQTISRLMPLGILNFRGQFLGYPTDFVANGNFTSSIGRITSDINLKIDEESLDKSRYEGKLSLTNFKLGQYLNDTLTFQNVSVSGKINGKGLTLETADFELDGTIESIGLLKYNYSNITTKARFASQFFNGQINIEDPNVKFKAEGSVDFRDKRNKVNIIGTLDSAYLHRLNLIEKELFLQAKLDIDMRGLVLDSLLGRMSFRDFFIRYDSQSLFLPEISFLSEKKNNNRTLNLESTLIDAEITGDFYPSPLFYDIKNLITEYRLNIENRTEATLAYYEQKKKKQDRYSADFDFTIKDAGPIMELLDIDLSISKNTTIDGRFTSGPTSSLQAFTFIDSLRFINDHLFKTEFEVSASKVADSTQALAMIFLHSRTQELSKIKTKNLYSEIIWDGNHVDVDLSISQQETTNRIDINGIVDFKDSTYIKLLPSSITILDNNWHIKPENKIAVMGKEWSFKNVGFTQLNQSISINGHLSADSVKQLLFSVKNFELTNINPIITRKLDGKLNADITVSDFYGIQNIQNTILINDLSVDDFLFGTITGNNVWDPVDSKFNVEFIIDRMNARIVNCSGYYQPSHSTSPLNINANFNKANLKIFEPFIDELFSQFQGTITGAYKLTGTLDELVLNGEGRLESGAMMVNYLNTIYQFTGIFGLTRNSIYFKEIELTDQNRNNGKLSGAITHSNFANMEISMDGIFEDFQVLNTTSKDNSLFYGQAYASGNVKFSGPIENLIITANATTRKNTRIYIPLTSSISVEQKEYINFVSFKDSTYLASQVEEAAKKIKLTGVTIDFNLEVTPDAYCEIIFDLKAGDIIRGRGNGKIKLQLDTKGEFNMFGPFEFTEGWYNFTLYDIINKEFRIQPGSSIAWYGDPYQGSMKIDATYNQLASLGPILSDPSYATIPQIRRKYPIQVYLKLDGPMLSPQISFDIVGKDLPKSIPVEGRPPISLDIEFTAFKSTLDEQGLKRQVFSLIVLRRFSPPESFAFNTGGSLVNSVSELFSNQLSSWLSQVDENLEIDVDLGSMDQEAFNAFQLRMSYTFMNGRLRVTRDGTLGNQAQATGMDQRNEIASAIGDWTVDYLLSADGKFKVKMYNRTNVNPLVNTLNTQSAFTTGVSLMHTQSFNEFKSLLRSNRNKNRRPREDDEFYDEDAPKKQDEGDE